MELDITYNLIMLLSRKLYISASKILLKNKSKLHVLHQSDNFLVVNKNEDLLINTNDPDIKETLQTQLLSYCPSKANAQLAHHFHFVHRLDYVTSGVVCIALHKRAAKVAGEAFTSRHAQKYYVALVRGWVRGERLSISYSVGEDCKEVAASKRMCVGTHPNCINPRNAHTRVLVLQRGLYEGYPATKVLLRPVTGRRHQLRVHLSHIGHTIVGDFTYSYRKDVTPPRTFLHALRLILPNPLEFLDIQTKDPFINVDKWRSLELVHRLGTETFRLLDEDDIDKMSRISSSCVVW